MVLTRCFVALELSREAINEIKNLQKIIGSTFIFTGKFTEPENLHLTLKFLGEIDEDTLERVREKLSRISFLEIQARLGDAGVFSKKFPKIIWISLNGVYELQKIIDDSLKGIFTEEERFMSHITLARIKYIKEKKELLEHVKTIKGKAIFKVSEFYLKKSELKSEGPIYTDLAVFPLLNKK